MIKAREGQGMGVRSESKRRNGRAGRRRTGAK